MVGGKKRDCRGNLHGKHDLLLVARAEILDNSYRVRVPPSDVFRCRGVPLFRPCCEKNVDIVSGDNNASHDPDLGILAARWPMNSTHSFIGR